MSESSHTDRGIESLNALKCDLLQKRWAVALFSDYTLKEKDPEMEILN